MLENYGHRRALTVNKTAGQSAYWLFRCPIENCMTRRGSGVQIPYGPPSNRRSLFRCSDGAGENLVQLHGGGRGHVDHLHELHGRREDPFELTDTRGTAPPERQGSKTYDESYDLSFWAGGASSGRDHGRGSVDLCPQHRRVALDDMPISTRANWPTRLNSPTSETPHWTGSSSSS
jgi:hypothetical protein